MNQDTKRIIKWLFIALIVIGSFVAIILVNQPSGDNGDNKTPTLTDVGTDEWTRGNANATVTLVEFSDLQCPACATREPLIEQLLNEFGNHIRFVYRHFPLRSIHPNGQMAAQAAEAAGLQEKFWEMHDLLFEKQNEWSPLSGSEVQETFVTYAGELGMDTEKFKNDLTSSAAENAVNEDYDSGVAAGVSSTPTFYLNGVKITPNSYEEFRSLIREKIEAAT